MRPELEHLQRLEDHLLGHPDPQQSALWEAQLLLDDALAADVNLQRQLYQGIYLAGRQQLRQELQDIHQQLYRPRRSWLRETVARLQQAWRQPPRHSRR
jgi:hypothetical protein